MGKQSLTNYTTRVEQHKYTGTAPLNLTRLTICEKYKLNKINSHLLKIRPKTKFCTHVNTIGTAAKRAEAWEGHMETPSEEKFDIAQLGPYSKETPVWKIHDLFLFFNFS